MGVDCQNPLVIAVSNSGNGARVSEAVQRAKLHGCYVLGITGNEGSALGVHCDKILKLEIPSFESAPGVRSYEVSLIALLLLAIRFGEVRGKYTMDLAMAYRYDIRDAGKALAEVMDAMDKACLDLADKWKDLPCYDFVGAGFDYASAWFGQAKILEATGKFAMHINSEEWFHLNFFARDAKNMGTFIVANAMNPAMSRNLELVHYANVLGRPICVITDGEPKLFGEDVTYIRVPTSKYPMTLPLTQFAPMALFAAYVSAMIGEEYGRGTKDEWSFAEHGACVTNSEIVVK